MRLCEWLLRRYTRDHKPGSLRYEVERENAYDDLRMVLSLLGLALIGSAIVLVFMLAWEGGAEMKRQLRKGRLGAPGAVHPGGEGCVLGGAPHGPGRGAGGVLRPATVRR